MDAEVIEVTITDGDLRGRGECVPSARYGETLSSVMNAIETLPIPIDRRSLQNLLPAGAARNAVDCALWDLESRRQGAPVWQIAGLAEPDPVTTAITISLDEPEKMTAQARQYASYPLMKVKLGGAGDQERIASVRMAAPDARMIVDANESWTLDMIRDRQEILEETGVEMIEQPLPAGQDQCLADIDSVITLCADESCHDQASLERLASCYGMINIKLDKTGGLTEALALAAEARRRNLRVMVGSMLGSSLAMAPAMLLAQAADIVDLDGPLYMVKDIDHGLLYESAWVSPPSAELWGGG